MCDLCFVLRACSPLVYTLSIPPFPFSLPPQTCSVPSYPCTASIAVVGFSTSQYQIEAYTRLQRLAAGVPVTGNGVAWDFHYYVFTVYDPAPFSISVTPLAGDPDL